MVKRRSPHEPAGSPWLVGPVLLLVPLLDSSCHLAVGIEDAEHKDGVGGPCSTEADCDDNNHCTVDKCKAGTCSHELLDGVDAPDEAQTVGDCQRAVCVAGVQQSYDDDSDWPDDEQQCTDEWCTSGVPSTMPLPGGHPCTQDGGSVCNGQGMCVECFSDNQCTAPLTCGGAAPWVCG